jgi:hypothetical protein
MVPHHRRHGRCGDDYAVATRDLRSFPCIEGVPIHRWLARRAALVG